MFSSWNRCLSVFQASSKASGLQENGDDKGTLVFPLTTGSSWCSDAHLRLREPQQGEGPKLSQASCSSTGFCWDTRRAVTPAARSRSQRVGTTLLLWISSTWVLRQSSSADSWSDCLSYRFLREVPGTTEDNVLWKTGLVLWTPLVLENNFHASHPEWLRIFACWCFAFI